MNMKINPEKIYLPYDEKNQTENTIDLQLDFFSVAPLEEVLPEYVEISIPLGSDARAFCSKTDITGINFVSQKREEWEVSRAIGKGDHAVYKLYPNQDICGEVYLFHMSHVISNTDLGMSEITAVLYWTDGSSDKPVRAALSKERPPLKILEFQALSMNVNAGDKAELAWNVMGCDQVDILPLGTGLLSRGRAEYQILKEETFRLTARNRTGETKHSQITVGLNTAEILEFKCNQGSCAEYGSTIQLSWQLKGSRYAKLLPVGLEFFGESNSCDITLNDDMEYVLECPGHGGNVTKSVLVAVSDFTIAEFSVEPAEVKKGEMFTIHWKTFRADRVTLYTGDHEHAIRLDAAEGKKKLDSFSDAPWMDSVDHGKAVIVYTLEACRLGERIKKEAKVVITGFGSKTG